MLKFLLKILGIGVNNQKEVKTKTVVQDMIDYILDKNPTLSWTTDDEHIQVRELVMGQLDKQEIEVFSSDIQNSVELIMAISRRHKKVMQPILIDYWLKNNTLKESMYNTAFYSELPEGKIWVVVKKNGVITSMRFNDYDKERDRRLFQMYLED